METVARRVAGRPADGAPAHERGARLDHEPALDGLRGLAVAAVVVFHLDHLRGGFLGVDLFFVLSGYLITSLLVVEHRGRGGIDLRAFWVRRARRLLPALLVMLAGVAVLLATLTASADRPRFRAPALATLGYVANWERMGHDVSYWEIFSQPSPLDHTWSLAIEEQFYLLWPLVVLAVLALAARRHGVRLLGVVAAAGGATSLVLLTAAYSPVDTNRAYFGTDTRLGPTLLGAALAVWAAGRGRRERAPTRAVEAAGVAALAWIAWSLASVDGQGGWYYRGGLASVTVAALVVIAVTTGGPPGRLARTLAARPLAALGRVSYGVYLWHWPVIVYLTGPRTGLHGATLAAARLVVTLAVALASYHVVEQPIRRGALRGGGAARAAVAAVALVAGLIVVVTRGPAEGGEAAGLAPTERRPYWIFPEPADIPAGATRVLLVGDSGPVFLGPELAAEADGRDDVAVAMSSQLLCSPVLVGGKVRYPDGRVEDRPVCTDRRHDEWREALDRFSPDVVVYYLANAGGLGRGLLDGEWVTDCDPAFDRYLEQVLTDDIAVLGAGGAIVVLATSPYVYLPTPTADEAVDCRNATYRRVAERAPGARVVDLNGFVVAEQAASGDRLMRDFVHLDGEGATRVARWLLGEIDDFA